MAAITNVRDGNAGALSESVRNIIVNTDPSLTPVYTMGMKKPQKPKARLHEWPIHSYTAAAANAQIEGATTTTSTTQSVEKGTSYCQLKVKGTNVSDTSRAVKGYGREDELGFKLAEIGMELKRDCEFAVVSAQASSAGSQSSGATMAGLQNQSRGNTTTGTGGSLTRDSGTGLPTGTGATSPYVAASTALRNLTQGMINRVISDLAKNTGGVQNFKFVANTGQLNRANDIFVTGQVNRYVDGDSKSVATGITMVRTQYGMLGLMLDNFIDDNTVLILDPAYVSYATLIPMETERLAKTGTAEVWQVKEQGTICALAPNRVAVINRLSA